MDGRNKKLKTNQDVKIEYIDSYNAPVPSKRSLEVVVEQVNEPIGMSNSQNLSNYDINSVKSRLQAELNRREDPSQQTLNSTNSGVTSLMEKFEKKMMQKIADTMFEITNELSKSFKRIEALSTDNAEYLEDCLRTNIVEISRCLKIAPKRQEVEKNNEVNGPSNDMSSEIEVHMNTNSNPYNYQTNMDTIDMNMIPYNYQSKIDTIDINMNPYSYETKVEYNEFNQDDRYDDILFNFGTTNEQPINMESTKIKQEKDFGGYEEFNDNSSGELETSNDNNDELTSIAEENSGLLRTDHACKTCNKMFSSNSNLRRHERRNIKCSSSNTSNVESNDIKVTFESETKDMMKEIKDERKPKIVKGEKRLPLLKLHPTKSHQKFNPDVPYKPCFFCPHAFQRITELIGHLQVNHAQENMDHVADIIYALSKDELKPEIIQKRLKDENYVKKDDERVFTGAINRCSFCPNDFGSFSRLLSHVRFIHPDCDKKVGHWTLKVFFAMEEKFPSTRVPCEICGRDVKLETLHTHMSNHKQPPKECPTCGKMIQSKSWQMHLRSHEDREWVCEDCGKVFKSQRRYRYHIPTHDPRFEGFKCNDCGKVFDRRPSLSKHIQLIHEGLQKFLCTYCPYKAGIATNLTMHIRRAHTLEKPYKCELCSYDTISSQELKRHIFAIHERDSHFQCEVCQWTSPRKHLMDMHVRLNCKMPPFTEADKHAAAAVAVATSAMNKVNMPDFDFAPSSTLPLPPFLPTS